MEYLKWNLTNTFLSTPSVRVEHFWVDLNGKHVFTPTPSVGVKHFEVDEKHVFVYF